MYRVGVEIAGSGVEIARPHFNLRQGSSRGRTLWGRIAGSFLFEHCQLKSFEHTLRLLVALQWLQSCMQVQFCSIMSGWCFYLRKTILHICVGASRQDVVNGPERDN